MEKIVYLDRGVFGDAVLPAPDFPHEWTNYQFSHEEEETTIQDRLKDATIVMSNRTPLTRRIVETAAHLKFVGCVGTGFDHIDVQACSERGITVSNVQDWAVSVPEHVFSLILTLRRQLLQYREAIAQGGWAKNDGSLFVLQPIPQALSGATMGIIGYGALGRRVERIATAFDMSVVIADRRDAKEIRQGRHSFEDVVRQSDVLVLLCPLTDETRGMISEAELSTMKKTALLINCARGGIVDEQALASALKSGQIAGAGVDVLGEEPPKNGNPLLDLELPNLIITSHVAWASTASVGAIIKQLIGNLEAFVSGQPRNVVSS